MTFRVGLTGDFYDDNGKSKFADLGLSVFEPYSHVSVARFDHHQPIIQPDQVAPHNGVIVLTPRVTADSVSQSENLLCMGRFGVGYDSVDVQACTDADVLVTITAGAVDRPVAEATVGWLIALTHRMLPKDRLVREGSWDLRTQYMGCELRDRTLGIIGLGGIGRTLVELLRGFGMRQPLAFDPYLSEEEVAKLGVQPASLDELMSNSDFVSIHCPLCDETRGLIGGRELSLMKPDAYLVNTARGGIVDEDALFDVLQKRQIAGAALDCFEVEPVVQPHRFGELDNTILAPHSIAWTHEMFRDMGRAACQHMLDLSMGRRITRGVINPELFDRESFRAKWQRIVGRDIQ